MGTRALFRMRQQEAFWHRNSSGLVEIAANQARAVDLLDIAQE